MRLDGGGGGGVDAVAYTGVMPSVGGGQQPNKGLSVEEQLRNIHNRYGGQG